MERPLSTPPSHVEEAGGEGAPLKPEELHRCAAVFHVERAVEEYLALFEAVLAPTLARAAPPATSWALRE